MSALVLAAAGAAPLLAIVALALLHRRANRSRRLDVERELYGRPHVRVRLLDNDDWGWSEWQ